MDYQKNLKNISVIKNQRNISILFSFILILATSMLSCFVFFKNDKVILVPPNFSKNVWVEGDTVSISYMEEMSLFFLHLLMDVNEQSILTQGKVLLRFVSPSYFGVMKERILSEQKRLQKDQISLRFSPVECKVPQDHKGLILDVVGDLCTYVGESKVSTKREKYRLAYAMKHGNFELLSLEVVHDD